MKSWQMPFTNPRGELSYMDAYDATLKRWPVPSTGRYLRSRFGMTHVVASGPKGAPPLILLHGFLTSLTMWAANIADLSRRHRVYAVDIMGQPNKSIPVDPIRTRKDAVEWLTSVLDVLRIERAALVGYEAGGRLALNYAIQAPERVKQLVVLSPTNALLRNRPPATFRARPLISVPTRFMWHRFMHFVTFKPNLQNPDVSELSDCLADQMYLGMKHFKMNRETLRLSPRPFSDNELRSLEMPTLVLIGQDEVLFDSAAALDRARRLIPNLEGQLISRAGHDMPYSQPRIVDALILRFLKDRPTRAGVAA